MYHQVGGEFNQWDRLGTDRLYGGVGGAHYWLGSGRLAL